MRSPASRRCHSPRWWSDHPHRSTSLLRRSAPRHSRLPRAHVLGRDCRSRVCPGWCLRTFHIKICRLSRVRSMLTSMDSLVLTSDEVTSSPPSKDLVPPCTHSRLTCPFPSPSVSTLISELLLVVRRSLRP